MGIEMTKTPIISDGHEIEDDAGMISDYDDPDEERPKHDRRTAFENYYKFQHGLIITKNSDITIENPF